MSDDYLDGDYMSDEYYDGHYCSSCGLEMTLDEYLEHELQRNLAVTSNDEVVADE